MPASGGPTDVHGVVGAVCMHTVPLRGMFCDMLTPEQFAYYLHLLSALVTERPELQHVYMDFGCRFKSTWQRYAEKHPGLPEGAKQLRIMVNWMHAVACQLSNSGRYQAGAGWPVGEQIEQRWSMAKVRTGVGETSSTFVRSCLWARDEAVGLPGWCARGLFVDGEYYKAYCSQTYTTGKGP